MDDVTAAAWRDSAIAEIPHMRGCAVIEGRCDRFAYARLGPPRELCREPVPAAPVQDISRSLPTSRTKGSGWQCNCFYWMELGETLHPTMNWFWAPPIFDFRVAGPP